MKHSTNGSILPALRIYTPGPELTEKAKEIAEKLGKSDFKGSRGWLDKWKKRYNIKQLRICGESGDVQGDPNIEIYVMYDIACSLIQHLKVRKLQMHLRRVKYA